MAQRLYPSRWRRRGISTKLWLQPARLWLNSYRWNEPCGRDITAHYSFDFTQQVHIPNGPCQPDPVDFLTPRKWGMFGVCCESLPQQENCLTHKGAASSKGSNAVISYLHHLFEMYRLGEKNIDLHCDNCLGQNKNHCTLWYFAWWAMPRCDDQKACLCHHQLHATRVYKLCSRLVLWTAEVEVQENQSILPWWPVWNGAIKCIDLKEQLLSLVQLLFETHKDHHMKDEEPQQ